MNSEINPPKKKWSKKRIILVSVITLVIVGSFLLYLNFNKLISVALNKSFESSLVSEVYELKFENLRVNPIQGSISVFNVTFKPREKPLNVYPYINSSLTLKTEGLILENVDIMLLLESNKLVLKNISITKPEIDIDVNSNNPILFPYRTSSEPKEKTEKKPLDSYFLNEFQLIDASIHLTNSSKKREFTIQNFNISLRELLIDHHIEEDLIFLKHIDLSLGKFTGNLTEDPLKHLSFSDFKINFDSVDVQKNLDTLIFNFQDFTAGVDSLDIQTKDSLYHVSMDLFKLAYQDQSVKMNGLSFKPNVSNSVIQKNYKFQHTQFSGTVGSLEILGLNFDSLFYQNKLFIEEIVLDIVSASIFKDNTKPKDLNRFPAYLGQTITGIKNPVRIKAVKATHVNLTNEERKPDGSMAKVTIARGTANVNNITNLAPTEELSLNAVAYLADKVQVTLALNFSYSNPEFTFEGRMSKFNLPDLNPIIKAYTPAEITKGTADEIKFTGLASWSGASGTMKFLYHELEVDLKLQDQAKWKSSVVSFGANTALISQNPISADSPERVVSFKTERDMNKGFVNLIIKSILNGMKETMIMSKENRQEFNQLKKETKKEAREAKRAAKKGNN